MIRKIEYCNSCFSEGFDITNPIMLTSLATLLLIRSVEYKNSREKSGFVLTGLTAVSVYVVVIYNVFIG